MREESSIAKGFGMACGCALFFVAAVVVGFASCTGIFAGAVKSVASPARVSAVATPGVIDRAVAEIDSMVAKRAALRKAVAATGWIQGEELLEVATLDGLTTGAGRMEVVERFGEPLRKGVAGEDSVMGAVCEGADYEVYWEGPVTFFYVGGRVKLVVVGLGLPRR